MISKEADREAKNKERILLSLPPARIQGKVSE